MVELFATDLRLSYELQFREKQSFKIDLGSRVPILRQTYKWAGTAEALNPYLLYGYNASIGYNYFIHNKHQGTQNYFSLRLFWSYQYRNNFVDVGGEDGTYGYVLTHAYKTNYKWDIIYGVRKFRFTNKNKSLIGFYELYFGGGMNFMNGLLEIKGLASGSDPTPSYSQIHFDDYHSKENSSRIFGDVCIGLKFGYSWRKK